MVQCRVKAYVTVNAPPGHVPVMQVTIGPFPIMPAYFLKYKLHPEFY